MNTFELFSGAGGLALGLNQSGFSCSGLLELNKDACKTLRSNFDLDVFEADASTFDYGVITKPVKLVAGGPPCQPFSLGGKGKGDTDKRDMFPQAIRAINELQPDAFIFENVKGLLRDSFTTYLEYIILRLRYPLLSIKPKENWIEHFSRLEKLKISRVAQPNEYSVLFRCLNAADYGVPQKRERVIIVGFRRELNLGWSFPEPSHSRDSLLFSKFVSKNYWDDNGILPVGEDAEILNKGMLEEKLRKKYGFFEPTELPWKTIRQTLRDLPEPTEEGYDGLSGHVLKKGAKSYPGHTGSPLDQPSKALKAGVHGVPGGENTIRLDDGSVRYFTVREAARIQTFPDWYGFSGAWGENMRQLGNAVPVELASIIGKSVISRLE